MDISVKHQEMTTALANVIVLGIFEDDKVLSYEQQKIDKALKGLISNDLIKKEGFKGKFLDSVIVPTQLKIPSDKIMLVGLGKKKDFDCTKLRELCSKVIKQLDKSLNTKNVSMELLGLKSGNFDAQACASAMTEGILIGMYDYDKYKSKKLE